MPAVEAVEDEVTNFICAPLATAPDHSTSRSASVSSSVLVIPGSSPFTITFALEKFAGRLKSVRKLWMSETLIFVSPTMAITCPVPSFPALKRPAVL